MCDFFFSVNTLFFCWKLAKFAIVKIWTFLGADTFISERFFLHKCSVILPKKFTTNCQNMNFSRDWYIFKWRFCLHKCTIILLKILKICYFCYKMSKDTFLGDIFLNEYDFFFHEYFIILPEIDKIRDYYRNMNFPSGWYF